MPKQSLCIFIVVIFKRNLTIIILIGRRSGKYYRVFQCDSNPDKGATQHASGTTRYNAKQACSESEKNIYQKL